MASGKKPIKITLFHANWCGHCTGFMPTWENMRADESSQKNIEYEEYEESAIGALDESMRTVNGRDVRSFGYPTIKITVNDKDYVYEGRRTTDDIYKSILEEIRESQDIDGPVTITKSEKHIDISTSEEAAGNYQNEVDPRSQTNTELSALKGGKKGEKSLFAKRLMDTDFKSFFSAGSFSEVARIK